MIKMYNRVIKVLLHIFQASEETEAERRRAQFTPPFQQLVTFVRGRVRYPQMYKDFRKDEKADFKSNRLAVGETLQDAAGELNFETEAFYTICY